MDEFKAYKYYMAVKLHFTTDTFNVFKNKGGVKGTRETFNARKDCNMFRRLSKKFPQDKDIIQFYVANMSCGNNIYEVGLEESSRCLTEWTKRKQSITKVFSDDLNRIISTNSNKSSLFEYTDNSYPIILKMFIGKQITLETLSIINDFENIISEWKTVKNITLLYENELRRIEKVHGFIKYDVNKITNAYKTFVEAVKEL